jgi:hypothetical protein
MMQPLDDMLRASGHYGPKVDVADEPTSRRADDAETTRPSPSPSLAANDIKPAT